MFLVTPCTRVYLLTPFGEVEGPRLKCYTFWKLQYFQQKHQQKGNTWPALPPSSTQPKEHLLTAGGSRVTPCFNTTRIWHTGVVMSSLRTSTRTCEFSALGAFVSSSLAGVNELKRPSAWDTAPSVHPLNHRTLPPLHQTRPPPLPWHPGTAGTQRPGRSCWTPPR